MIAAVAGGLGEHRYPQQQITDAFERLVLDDAALHTAGAVALMRRVHEATGVQQRHLVLPLGAYEDLTSFRASNDAFIDKGVELGARVVTQALEDCGLASSAVDLMMSTTVTGIAAPSLDARLVPALGLRQDIKRVPVFGLGCVAGASGIARVSDYLTGHPDDVAVLVSVELCSLTVQRHDSSPANLVASGLFADGAAAVVMVGDERARALGIAGPAVRSTRSVFYPDSERVMGWDIGGSGFTIVLAPTVADVVRLNIGSDVKGYLAHHDLDIADIDHWIAHPGGPKVLMAMQESLGVDQSAFAVSWESLRQVGNLSSASVLHVLRDTMREHPPGSGASAMLMAMGPGFCAELVLLEW